MQRGFQHPALGVALSALMACAPSISPVAFALTAPSALDSTALSLLADAIGDRKLVLLGEMHGTQEIPALAGDLVELASRHGKTVILALEILSGDQPGIDRYLASSGAAADHTAVLASPHWREPHHDGRDSKAMLELIERMRVLRTQGRDVSIVLFDPVGEDDRNRGMAVNLRRASQGMPQALLLVLTGNVHAMTHRPPWEMRDESGAVIDPPMTAGRYLADLHPLSIDIEAVRGSMWNCSGGSCGIQSVSQKRPQLAQPILERNEASASAWDATLILPQFTASAPAEGNAPV